MPILDEAARRFGAQIGFQHHAFELRPEPVPLLDPKGPYILEHWNNRVLPMAAERGLAMAIPPVQTRTRRAHETAKFAEDHGRFGPVDQALLRGFLAEGLDINDVGVLERIVRGAGLDGNALRLALEAGTYGPAVDADVTLAARLGIRSVPTMLVADESGRAEPVVGAVPYEHLHAAIERALERDRQATAAPGS